MSDETNKQTPAPSSPRRARTMATEQEYDEILAPMLAEVAQKSADLGMSFVARVEWEPGEAGITQIGPQDISIGQRMAWFAVHSQGNIDKMILSMQRAGIDFSQSIYLHQFTGDGKHDR